MPNLDYKAFLNNTEPLTNTDYLKLSEILRFHEHQYYVLDNPLISDYEYDLLYKILESTENQHPDWITNDSPTQRVSSDLKSSFDSVAHLTPLCFSLDNTYNLEDLQEFDKE
ncbi:MAG: hypothetical protein IPO62_08960 [Saprospiraceae bacterium]|nr:hypothetical protein [Saprospiraceae bacterium]